MTYERNIPLDRLRCHAFGHSFDDIAAQRKPQFGILLTLRCPDCQTVREDIVTSWGDLLTRNYIYQDDYQTDPYHTRSEWRAIYARRLFAIAREQQRKQKEANDG